MRGEVKVEKTAWEKKWEMLTQEASPTEHSELLMRSRIGQHSLDKTDVVMLPPTGGWVNNTGEGAAVVGVRHMNYSIGLIPTFVFRGCVKKSEVPSSLLGTGRGGGVAEKSLVTLRKKSLSWKPRMMLALSEKAA